MSDPGTPESVTSPFATLSPFRNRFFELWERVIYLNSGALRVQEPTMKKLSFLQHAQWLTLPAARRGAREGGPKPRTALLFMSYFTGDLPDYLRGFTDKLGTPMDLLWGPCEEWPRSANYESSIDFYAATKKFIEKYRRKIEVYYNGRGGLNVGAARVALETRRKLDKLRADVERGISEAEFMSAYVDAACTSVLRDLEVES